MQVINIAIIGSKGVGKSTFVNRWLTGEFRPSDEKAFTLPIYTSSGPVFLNIKLYNEVPGIWETLGQVDGIMLMCDLSNMMTLIDLINFQHHGVPTVVCGNKSEQKILAHTEKHGMMVHFISMKGLLAGFEISAKSNYNFEKPFLTLVRKIKNDPNLTFVEAFAIEPPIVPIPFPTLVD